MMRVAVKYRAGASAEEISTVERKHGLTALRDIPPLGIRGYEVSPELVAALSSEAIVEYVEEDGEQRIL